MIIALSVAYDEGTFAVHYAGAQSMREAEQWLADRGTNLEKMGIEHARAILNTDHVKWIEDCAVEDPQQDDPGHGEPSA